MEPFHQLRIPREVLSALDVDLESMGITVTHLNDSWLGRKHADFHDMICERNATRAGFALGPDPSEDHFALVVYVNVQGDTPLQNDLVAYLTSRGAEWGYFDD